jgi:hypothetical protein
MQISDETIERIRRGEEVTIIVQGDPSHRLEALLGEICYQAHKHEVQHWNDAPGTDAEKLKRIIVAAREALAIVRECKAKIAP